MNNNSQNITINIPKDKTKKVLQIILYIIPLVSLFIININLDSILRGHEFFHATNLLVLTSILFNCSLILKNVFKFDSKFNTMIVGVLALFLLCERIYDFITRAGADMNLDTIPYIFLMMLAIHLAAFSVWFIINSVIKKVKGKSI